VAYVQNNLRILSGLYGALRPLDLIQPYRLEMGSKLSLPATGTKDLYSFWAQTPLMRVLSDDLATRKPQVGPWK
jgi:cytoplasmic iron level regulating protein YaaA (DUF328/UPF0246 family)